MAYKIPFSFTLKDNQPLCESSDQPAEGGGRVGGGFSGRARGRQVMVHQLLVNHLRVARPGQLVLDGNK